jgi:hypothetical protein
MKRKEGPHSRATSKDDAPDWWIKAHIDSLKYGTGIILVHGNKSPEHITWDRYPELAGTLTAAHAKIAQENTN